MKGSFFQSYPLIAIALLLGLGSCGKPKISVDIILHHGQIVTVDSAFSSAEAVAVSGDSIVAVGTNKDILSRYKGFKEFDLDGKVVYPGFIDAHCHFFHYGQDLQELDLKNCISFDNMIQKTVAYAQKYSPTIIVGRGWNEENWESKTTPSNFKLNALFPNIPVILQRVDGHAALCNQAALDLASIDENTEIDGGEIVKMGYQITGMLIDKAAEKVLDQLPELSTSQKITALREAQEACFAKGLTTVADAGLDKRVIDLIDSLQSADLLKIRVYAMANPNMDELNELFANGLIDKNRLKVRSVKLYCDGSLGSRGALLKQPYCDQPDHNGLIQNPESYYRDFAKYCFDRNLQVNTHCIGDSANAFMLALYGDYLKGKNDRRWRIEHAQVVDPRDYHLFADYSIIPSVQPTHATSDMYMARERLCDEKRLLGAYAYKSLAAQNGWIAFGTDFPVESIDPLNTYFSAVKRTGNKGEVFQPEEAVSEEDAIRAMTIWAAKANFMEKEVGSIEVGKKADLVVLSTNLKFASDKSQSKLYMTIVEGEIVYNQNLLPTVR